ncbi:hypothetical protein FRB90_005946, partial [Tulasnella sp. 427]
DRERRSGGFGTVQKAQVYVSAYLPAWLASYINGPPQTVAVKQIRMSAADDPFKLKRAFTKELRVWSSLGTHSGISKLIGFYADFDQLEAWLLSPWEPHGNITEFIRQHQLEVPEKLSLVYDSINGLAFLHSLDPPVCHGDIKSSNVLVNLNYRAVFCDFGLSRVFDNSGSQRPDTTSSFNGSIRWCSPELLEGATRSPKSDIYAWAWLVSEIMTGELPYQDTIADYVVIRKIFENPRLRMKGSSRLAQCLRLRELMTRCWSWEPEERPTSQMCKVTVSSLPHCAPLLQGPDGKRPSAELLENLGILKGWKGDFDDSMADLNNALKLYQAQDNAKGVAGVLLNQAKVFENQARYNESLEHASAALKELRPFGDEIGSADGSLYIGIALVDLSEFSQAMPHLREALEIYRAHENYYGAVRCLEKQSDIYRMQNKHQDALRVLEDALAHVYQSGDKLSEAEVLESFGYLFWDTGRIDDAVSTFSHAHDIAQQIGHWEIESGSLWAQASIELERENYDVAETTYQESITVARAYHDCLGLAQGHRGLSQTLHRRGNLLTAIEMGEESYRFYRDISFRGWERTAMARELSTMKEEQGDLDASVFWLRETLSESRKLGRDEVQNHVYQLIRRAEGLLHGQKNWEACLFLEASLVLSREEGFAEEAGRLVSMLASAPKATL